MRVAAANERWKKSGTFDLQLGTEKEGREFNGLSTTIGSDPMPMH